MVVFSKGEYQGEVDRLLSAGEMLVGLTSYQKGTDVTPLHSHQNAHLSFVLNGIMQVRRKTLISDRTAKEGVSFVYTGELHENKVLTSACRNINLELDADFFAKYELTESIVAEGVQKNVLDAGLLMVRLYKEVCLYDEFFTESVHMLLLDAISGYLGTESSGAGWLMQVRDLLHDRWLDSVSLEEIARTVGIHPVNVSRYFSRHFGTGIGNYRRRLKVERAIQMITSSKMSFTEVAYACGFFDQSHFVRAFKEQTGLLPGQLRSER
jgi:AraC family transcriptional regulator